jgi:ATP-binding cassette, subfamily F, member 3
VHETIHIRLSPSTRTGDLVLRTENLQAGYEPGRPIVSAGDLEVRTKERLAILGGNGSGKTTLLRTVLGSLEPLAGKLQWGSNVVLGYLSQTHESLRGEDTVVESLTKPPYALTTPAARDLLGMFHFRGDDVLKRISELSGGQRSRVMLAQVSALGANVLLLDEPTNHLDLPSREILQETLAEFPGTVIFVSHDRYLVQGLATDIWHVEDGRVHPVGGGWQEYLSWRTRHQGGTGETSRPEDAEKLARKQDYEQTKRDRRAAERARRRLRQVEKQITELEQRLEQLGDEITSAGETGDMDALHRLGEEYRAVEDELTARMEEWEQLGEQVENA